MWGGGRLGVWTGVGWRSVGTLATIFLRISAGYLMTHTRSPRLQPTPLTRAQGCEMDTKEPQQLER